ncbi:hypothetical protein, partial [Sporisorium scitamineum]
LARSTSLATDAADAPLHTPNPTDTAFPSDSRPSQETSIHAAAHDAEDGIVASSSSATFVAAASNDETPLSSAEIRDSQSASDSLILDEESAKATLSEQVEKVPPSVGATSMLEPDETISNPFASGDDSSSQPIRYSQTASGDSGAASANQPPDTPGINSNHFSVVSLGSTSASNNGGVEDDAGAWSASNRRDSRRDTITTNGARSSLAEGVRSNDSEPARNGDESSSNYDFLLARLDTQNKRLSGDPKQMRASFDGAVKLREHFEKLRDQGQRHSRTDSQNRGLDEQGSSSVDTNAQRSSTSHSSQPPVAETSAEVGVRESITSSSADTAWSGPPAEDVGDEEIDWEFWGDVMSNYQQVARTQPRQLSRAIQAGIPPALRGMMWQLMSSSKNEEMEIIYAYYLKQTSTHEKAIRRDLNRTFPEQDYFQDGKGIGQENLFNVIKAYSLYDPEVGYCQGMQFVVGPLLLNMPDEEAFSTFVRLMKSYDLRGHFTPNMPALQLRLFQFDRLLEDFLPFPLEFVYRILDSVFAEGVEALFRFAIALMRRNEERLLEMGFDQAVQFLKMELFECYRRTESEGCTGEEVITPFILDTFAAEFDVQVRAANAHRREVEALRLVNRNLAARVKALEEQLNSVNAEHVEMVKDVVMAKIAKEEMAEELVKYKMMYAEAVLAADRESGNNRSSARGIAAAKAAAVKAEEGRRDSGSSAGV